MTSVGNDQRSINDSALKNGVDTSQQSAGQYPDMSFQTPVLGENANSVGLSNLMVPTPALNLLPPNTMNQKTHQITAQQLGMRLPLPSKISSKPTASFGQQLSSLVEIESADKILSGRRTNEDSDLDYDRDEMQGTDDLDLREILMGGKQN